MESSIKLIINKVNKKIRKREGRKEEMKHTILGYQQIKALEMNLDIIDLLILRTLQDMYGSGAMEYRVISDKQYQWISWKYLLKEIPLIKLKVTSLKNRITKLGNLNLLEREHVKEKNGEKGSFAYFRPGEALMYLEDYDPYPSKMTKDVISKGRGVSFQNDIKDPSTKNPSTIDSSISIYLSKVAEITKLPKQVIENMWKIDDLQHFELDKVLKEIEKSAFLKGEVPATSGRYVSAEHFLREEYVAKIISKQYRDKIKKQKFTGNIKKENSKVTAMKALEDYKKSVGLTEDIEKPETIEAEVIN